MGISRYPEKVIATRVTGNVDGSVGSVAGNVGGNVAGSVGSVTGNIGGNVAGSVASVTGNVGGNVAGSVGSVLTEILPKKAYSSVYSNGSMTDGTYYTALNVSGKGMLNAVYVLIGGLDAIAIQIKITVDGSVYEFAECAGISGTPARPTVLVSGAGSELGAVYNGPVYFASSVKVEIKSTVGSGGPYAGECVCDYALV